MIGLVTYMCACLYRFDMSGHHQMHFIDIHIIIFSKSLQEDLVEPQLDNRDSMY